MAAFPAIEPLKRSYGLGAHPMAVAGFSSSDEVRFLQGATPSGVPLSLEFVALTTSEATEIHDHYLGQRQHQPFTITTALWRTHSSQFNAVPAASIWRYAGPPQESPRSGGLVDVTVSLVSAFAPEAARILNGGTFTQAPDLSAGAIDGYVFVNGGTFAQAPSLAPGAFAQSGGTFAQAPSLSPGTFTEEGQGGAMLAFTGGTSLAWDNDNVFAYGFSFTLASAKQIKAVGFYDAGGNGLAYSFAVSLVSGWGSSVTTATFPFITTDNLYSVIVPSGTAAALDGVWRKVTIGNGATLAAGTYAVVATVDSGTGAFDAMINNASTVTPLSGVTINGPFGYDFNDDVIDTSSDTNGYFGPVLFF